MVKPVRRVSPEGTGSNVSFEEAERIANQLADKTYGQPVQPVQPTQPAQTNAQPAPVYSTATSQVMPTGAYAATRTPIRTTETRSVSIPIELLKKLDKYTLQNKLNNADRHRSVSSVITELLEDFLSRVEV